MRCAEYRCGGWQCQPRGASPLLEHDADADRRLVVVVVDQAVAITGSELEIELGRTSDLERARPVELQEPLVTMRIEIAAQQQDYLVVPVRQPVRNQFGAAHITGE